MDTAGLKKELNVLSGIRRQCIEANGTADQLKEIVLYENTDK